MFQNAAFGAYDSVIATGIAGWWEMLIWEGWGEENNSMVFLFVISPLYCTNDKSEQISDLIWYHISHNFGYVREHNTNLASFQNQFAQPALMSCH